MRPRVLRWGGGVRGLTVRRCSFYSFVLQFYVLLFHAWRFYELQIHALRLYDLISFW